jgi:hypothetical protein
MSSLDLAEIVQALFAGDRGLLAMDESVETCNKSADTGEQARLSRLDHQNPKTERSDRRSHSV